MSREDTKFCEHIQSLPHFSVSVLLWRNLAVFPLVWIVAIQVMESHATLFDVQCQIKALPEHALRLSLGITPEAKA